jgi:hypothetical protein
MQFKQGADREVLEAKSGGGCLFLFGLPFFIAGLAVIAISIGLWQPKGDRIPWYFGIPFGGVFAAVGGGLMFGRAGTKIDARTRTITKWWGMLVPFKQTDHDLESFTHVTITKEIRRSDKSTYTVYPVRLLGDGDKKVDMAEPRDYKGARELAEQIGKFIRLDVVDTTSGEEVRREWDHLDESLRDRVERTHEAVEVSEPPPNMKTVCEIEGRRIALQMPPSRNGCAIIAPIIGAIIIPIFLFTSLGQFFEEIPEEFRWIGFAGIALLVAIPILVILSVVLRVKRGGVCVVASRDGIELTERGAFFAKTRFIPADELEELILPHGDAGGDLSQELADSQVPDAMKSIIKTVAKSRFGTQPIEARSDNLTLAFGAGLSTEEQRWIHGVVMKIVTVRDV